jgi:hypothetical protein
MAAAHYVQATGGNVPLGKTKTLATRRLPVGSYVLIAKCTVHFQLDVDRYPGDLSDPYWLAAFTNEAQVARSAYFELTFAGVTDKCQVRATPDTISTVCVIVAGTHSPRRAAAGGGLSGAAIFRGYTANPSYIRAWVRDIALTAIPVDEIA